MNAAGKSNIPPDSREEEFLMAECLRAARIGSWLLDLSTNRVVWSDETYRVYGVSPESFVLTIDSFLLLIHTGDLALMQEWLRACKEDEKPGGIEFRAMQPDGSFKYLYGRGSLVRDQENRPLRMVGTVQDITDRKLAEEALRVAGSYNRRLIEASLDPLVAIGPDGKITDVNTATEKATGRAREQLVGTDFSDYFTEPRKAREGYEQVFREGEVWDFPLKLRHRDGTVMSVLYNASLYRSKVGDVVGVFAAARDVTDLERAMSAVSQSEARFRSLVTALSEIVWTTTPEGLVRDDIPAWRAYTGQTYEEFKGSGWSQAIHPDDLDRTLAVWKQAVEDRSPYKIEYRLRRHDGQYRHFAARGVPVIDLAGDIREWVGLCTDIHEVKLAEEKILHLASIVESSDDAIIGIALDEKILSWNRGAQRIYGYRADEIVGRPISVLVPANLRKELDGIMERLKRGESIEHFETARVRKDGKLINVSLTISPIKDALGKVVGASTVARDVTERRMLEKRERMRVKVMEDLTKGISLHEILTGIVLHIEEENRGLIASILVLDQSAGRLLLGAAPSLPKFYNETIHGMPIGQGIGSCGTAAFSGKRVVVENIQTHPYWEAFRDLAMRARVAACWSEPIISSQGSVLGTFAIYHRVPYAPTDRDLGLMKSMAGLTSVVIEHRRAEEEIQKLNEDLEQRVTARTAQLESANKELEAFAYSVSHDLRAPLRSIDGFSKILLEDCAGKLDEASQENLRIVRSASQRMARLIDDILQLSRLNRAQLHLLPVDLSALAASVADDLKKLEPGRGVDFQIEAGCIVLADGGQMRVVLENLIGNAWKFTGRRPDASIGFGREVRDGNPLFFVRDNGVGFDMKYAPKLFGAFQRLHTTSEFPGTGIGLASVQRIIHRHGGKVWIEGRIGGGATAYFSIPKPEQNHENNPPG